MTNKFLIRILEFRFWISTWFSGMRALIAIWYFVFRDKDCCQNGRMEYNEEIAATISIRAVDWRGGKQTNVCWMLVYLVLIKHEIIYIVSARCSYISYLPPSLCDLLGGGKIENMLFVWMEETIAIVFPLKWSLVTFPFKFLNCTILCKHHLLAPHLFKYLRVNTDHGQPVFVVSWRCIMFETPELHTC